MNKRLAINLLCSSHFEQHPFGPWKFAFPAAKLSAFDHEFEDPNLSACYSDRGAFSVRFETNQLDSRALFGGDQFCINDDVFDDQIQWLIERASVDSENNGFVVATPSVQPTLIQFAANAIRVEAVVLNGPRMPSNQNEIVLQRELFELKIKQFEQTNEFYQNSKINRYERIATSCLCVSKIDGSVIDAETAYRKLGFVCRYFTFATGTYSAIGNIIGYDKAGEVVFAYLGFSATDHFHSPPNGFSHKIPNQILDCFACYQETIENVDNKFPLLRTIEFCRASNAAVDSSMETALIVSYAALETIVSHTLTKRAG